MMIKAIIFDVDGTLADTEDGHRLSFNKAFAQVGLDWSWDVELYDKLLKVTGGKERIKYFVSDFLQGYSKPDDFDGFVKNLHAIKTQHYTAMIAEGGVPLRPGIKTLIEQAHAAGITLAIATTTTPENVSALLEVGLGKNWADYFSANGCGDIVPHKKPAPDIYLRALGMLRLPAHACVAFEDSVNGLKSAKAAGLYTVVTPTQWNAGQDFRGADLVLQGLGDADAPLDARDARLAGGPCLTLARLQELHAASLRPAAA
jgi:HAD superfamily hydrolase (TIGR01509 family)